MVMCVVMRVVFGVVVRVLGGLLVQLLVVVGMHVMVRVPRRMVHVRLMDDMAVTVVVGRRRNHGRSAARKDRAKTPGVRKSETARQRNAANDRGRRDDRLRRGLTIRDNLRLKAEFPEMIDRGLGGPPGRLAGIEAPRAAGARSVVDAEMRRECLRSGRA